MCVLCLPCCAASLTWLTHIHRPHRPHRIHDRHTLPSDLIDAADPFSSIGSTMITLINMGAGLSHYDYNATCRSGYVLSTAMCTIYYLLWLATVILLLMNLLTGEGAVLRGGCARARGADAAVLCGVCAVRPAPPSRAAPLCATADAR